MSFLGSFFVRSLPSRRVAEGRREASGRGVAWAAGGRAVGNTYIFGAEGAQTLENTYILGAEGTQTLDNTCILGAGQAVGRPVRPLVGRSVRRGARPPRPKAEIRL